MAPLLLLLLLLPLGKAFPEPPIILLVVPLELLLMAVLGFPIPAAVVPGVPSA